MPLSHDSKPRNKCRRQKAMRVHLDGALVAKADAARAAVRRLLRRRFEDQFMSQSTVEKALLARGVSWRQVEKMVHKNLDGKFSKLKYSKLLDWFGVDVRPQAMEAA